MTNGKDEGLTQRVASKIIGEFKAWGDKIRIAGWIPGDKGNKEKYRAEDGDIVSIRDLARFRGGLDSEETLISFPYDEDAEEYRNITEESMGVVIDSGNFPSTNHKPVRVEFDGRDERDYCTICLPGDYLTLLRRFKPGDKVRVRRDIDPERLEDEIGVINSFDSKGEECSVVEPIGLGSEGTMFIPGVEVKVGFQRPALDDDEHCVEYHVVMSPLLLDHTFPGSWDPPSAGDPPGPSITDATAGSR